VLSAVAEVLHDVSSAFQAIDARWYLFGAQAAIVYGAARLTADVDVSVELGDRPTRVLVDTLLATGFGLRVVDSDEFVARTRVLPVVHTSSRVPVDVVLTGPGIEELFLQRVQVQSMEGILVPVACADDIVVMKILAGRPKDLEDAAAIVAAMAKKFERRRAFETLRLLEQALDRSDLVPELERLLRA
jgi:hypothetical protein